MIIVALVFLLYAFFGPYVPGIMAHRGVGLEEMFDHLFFTTEGIFGTPMGVSSTFIYLFILFGAYLEATGLGKFLQLAFWHVVCNHSVDYFLFHFFKNLIVRALIIFHFFVLFF